jgi:hypothetical protein
MGSGGMRYGAGRPGWHGKVEHHRSIDVRRFQRENMLRLGSWSWQWSDVVTGEVKSSISIWGDDHQITLRYTIDGRNVSEPIAITRTACHYGNTRAWFMCPRCTGRVAKLYLRGGRFACRKCQKLVYGSQSEDMMGRAWRLQQRLEARLGPNWSRLKGMHRSTLEKLHAGIYECEQLREDALAQFMSRLRVIEGKLASLPTATKRKA